MVVDISGDASDVNEDEIPSQRRRMARRRSYSSRALIGDGEKARLDASGLAGFLNDSIITMGLERLCEQDNINVRAVPTNPQTFT
jgi:hypothetical protein